MIMKSLALTATISLLIASAANADTIAFAANFDGTTVSDLGGTNGYGAQITEANLNAGTTVGTWSVNQAQALGGKTARMIQTDGGANVTNKALRFGIDFTDGTTASTTNANTPILTANLTSTLSLSNTINVSFDQGMISSDGGAVRITYLTGRDGSNNRLFQIGFNAAKQLGYVSSAGVWTLIGTAGDLAGNNNTFWDDVNMKTVTVDVGPTTYDIKLNGNPLTGGSGIAFRDGTANGLSKLEFSANHRYTGSAFDNMTVSQVSGTVDPVKILDYGFNGPDFEVVATNLNPATQYVLTRSENLTDGFPTVVDGPRLPAADGTPETDTFTDDSAAGTKGFYRVEESPAPE